MRPGLAPGPLVKKGQRQLHGARAGGSEPGEQLPRLRAAPSTGKRQERVTPAGGHGAGRFPPPRVPFAALLAMRPGGGAGSSAPLKGPEGDAGPGSIWAGAR